MMTFKQIKENKFIKFVSNKYVIVLTIFIVWMLFFDENSYLNHKELNDEIEKLESANEYFTKEIQSDKAIIDNLNHPDSLEKYAREQYRMKKKNEDIFIIEYDSVKE